MFNEIVKATRRFRLLAVTAIGLAMTWLWAAPPVTTSLLYIHSNGWTDADLVRHIWPVRLVQPGWVTSPPQYDYLRWTQAETLARLSVVFIAWIASVGGIVRTSLRRQPFNRPSRSKRRMSREKINLEIKPRGMKLSITNGRFLLLSGILRFLVKAPRIQAC